MKASLLLCQAVVATAAAVAAPLERSVNGTTSQVDTTSVRSDPRSLIDHNKKDAVGSSTQNHLNNDLTTHYNNEHAGSSNNEDDSEYSFDDDTVSNIEQYSEGDFADLERLDNEQLKTLELSGYNPSRLMAYKHCNGGRGSNNGGYSYAQPAAGVQCAPAPQVSHGSPPRYQPLPPPPQLQPQHQPQSDCDSSGYEGDTGILSSLASLLFPPRDRKAGYPGGLGLRNQGPRWFYCDNEDETETPQPPPARPQRPPPRVQRPPPPQCPPQPQQQVPPPPPQVQCRPQGRPLPSPVPLPQPALPLISLPPVPVAQPWNYGPPPPLQTVAPVFAQPQPVPYCPQCPPQQCSCCYPVNPAPSPATLVGNIPTPQAIVTTEIQTVVQTATSTQVDVQTYYRSRWVTETSFATLTQLVYPECTYEIANVKTYYGMPVAAQTVDSNIIGQVIAAAAPAPTRFW